jgi:hypothetical protein
MSFLGNLAGIHVFFGEFGRDSCLFWGIWQGFMSFWGIWQGFMSFLGNLAGIHVFFGEFGRRKLLMRVTCLLCSQAAPRSGERSATSWPTRALAKLIAGVRIAPSHHIFRPKRGLWPRFGGRCGAAGDSSPTNPHKRPLTANILTA